MTKSNYAAKRVFDYASNEIKLMVFPQGGTLDKAMKQLEEWKPDPQTVQCFQDANVVFENNNGIYSATIKKRT